MPPEAIHQDHRVIGVAHVLKIGVPAVAGDFLGLFQHPIHVIEVDIGQERGNYSALGYALPAGGLQDHLEQVQHVPVLDPLRYFGQQNMMPDIVKVDPQVHVDDVRLVLDDGFGHPLNGPLGLPFGHMSRVESPPRRSAPE